MSYESPLEAHARKIPSKERRKYPPKVPIPPDSEDRQTGNVYARHGSVFARHGSVFALQGDGAASPWYGRRDHIWNTYCVLTWATPWQPVRALLFVPGTCELFSLYAAYSSYWTFSRLSYSSNVIFIVLYPIVERNNTRMETTSTNLGMASGFRDCSLTWNLRV